MAEGIAEVVAISPFDLEAWRVACERAKERDGSGGLPTVEREYHIERTNRMDAAACPPVTVEPMDDEVRKLIEETMAAIRAKA